MKIRIEFSNAAQIDFEAIIAFYYPLNKKTASRYYSEILQRIESLAAFPEIGRIVPEFENEFYDRYRELICEHFIIIYRIEGEGIAILRMIDGRRLLRLDMIAGVE
jgi:plasmid stabilization system protein ParE